MTGSPAPTLSEARLASVLETAVDAIIIIDDQARILVYNAACERMFGYTAQEAIGENVKLIMPPVYSEKHDTYMENYLGTGDRKIIGIGREVLAAHKDGTVFPVELSVGEAKMADSRQFIGILRDLRPRIENEKRLSELQGQLIHMARVSALDEMGATLAHELNQPLTAIMLYLDALKRSVSGLEMPGIFDQVVEKTVREADRAGAIIRRLRQFVERKEMDRQAVELPAVIDDAIGLASIGARSRGIEIKVTRPDDVPSCFVDPIQIQQIIINLVRNAIDAIGESGVGSTITVGCTKREPDAVLTVTDDGPGIDPLVRSDLFKSFTSTKENGLGIGLSIAQSIAQNHGGELTASDNPHGKGTCFELRLPLEKS